MKTNFLKIFGLGAVLLVMGCNNSQEANQNTAQNSDSVREDKTQVYIDTADQMAFRRNEEELIKENNERIAKLKDRIRDEKKAIAENDNIKLDTLNQENSRMEQRLNEFKEKTKADWEAFKYDFNKHMDSLGKSISRFAENNLGNNRK